MPALLMGAVYSFFFCKGGAGDPQAGRLASFTSQGGGEDPLLHPHLFSIHYMAM